MASPTRKARARRVMKMNKTGRRRKNYDRLHGSTLPNLPLNKPNANELAQKKAKA